VNQGGVIAREGIHHLTVISGGVVVVTGAAAAATTNPIEIIGGVMIPAG